MGWIRCSGSVTTLREQKVLFTGKTHVDGEWLIKKKCRETIERKGATYAENRSRDVTLLVLGDLSTQIVVDPVNMRSQNAVFVEEQRRCGKHICVVDGQGFSALLRGESADCLSLHRVDAITVSAARQAH